MLSIASRERTGQPIRVLFLCTGHSARSQIAEALLTKKGGARFIVGSAGSTPAKAVRPEAVVVLKAVGIDWSDRQPKGLDAIKSEDWDLVITLCDRSKEACATIPGRPMTAHWGVPDPAEVKDAERRNKAFDDAVALISWRLDLMLALPPESLETYAAEERIRAFGTSQPSTEKTEEP